MEFEQAREYIDELAFLVETAGAKTMRSFIQRLPKPHNKTYVGTGKLMEIKAAVDEAQANMVVFDDDLTPSQLRNIEEAVKVKILDRSSLILYIFSTRARTSQAKLQVDLAQYQYLLPRLAGMWTHLSRQRGGVGLKGAGEKEIETDRRVIRDKIAKLKLDLAKIDKQENNRRKDRRGFVRVALVGYTNVGKSTVMNLLSKSQVLAEDKLFATLDTTVRKVFFGDLPFLLSDTVGFIRKLPVHLVESFKGTLAEASESDILIHVVDVSNVGFESQIKIVQETLKELQLAEKTIITVFNKVDLLPEAQLENAWWLQQFQPAVAISAKTRYNIQALRNILAQIVVDKYKRKMAEGEKTIWEPRLIMDNEDFSPSFITVDT